jgi:hypothetical protein
MRKAGISGRKRGISKRRFDAVPEIPAFLILPFLLNRARK